MFKSNDTKSKTVVFSENYLSNIEKGHKKSENKVTLVNVDREVIQNVMDVNNSFRE